MLGGNLRWTIFPTKGSRLNTPSRFILQKPEISVDTDEPSASPNYDWDRLYYYILKCSCYIQRFCVIAAIVLWNPDLS